MGYRGPALVYSAQSIFAGSLKTAACYFCRSLGRGTGYQRIQSKDNDQSDREWYREQVESREAECEKVCSRLPANPWKPVSTVQPSGAVCLCLPCAAAALQWPHAMAPSNVRKPSAERQ